LEFYRKKNRRLGYGTDEKEWKKEAYVKQIKELRKNMKLTQKEIDDDLAYRKQKQNCWTRSERIERLSIFSSENREKPTRAEAQFLTLLYQVHKYLELSQRIDIGSIYTQQVITSNTAKTGYILDFYLPRINLAFEVDGSFHDNRKNYDKIRDEYIATKGLKIIRYKNEDVFVNGFRDVIRGWLKINRIMNYLFLERKMVGSVLMSSLMGWI